MLHQNHLKRSIGLLFIVLILSNSFIPAIGFALTEGPSQPEFTQFEPFSTTEMVDLFTGDFTYNIPLFELPGPNGGYPFNLAYHSGATMDQEASWVGLGWSLNAGAINRQMRGLPDDFTGENDKIKETLDIENNWTVGVDFGAGVDFPFVESIDLGLDLSIGTYYNNYRGVGMNAALGVGPSFDFLDENMKGMRIAPSLNVSLDSFEGVGVSPNLSIDFVDEQNVINFNAGISMNSISGLKTLNLGASSYKEQKVAISRINNRKLDPSKSKNQYTQKQNAVSYSASLSVAGVGYTPYKSPNYKGKNISIRPKFGVGAIVYPNMYFNGYYSNQKLESHITETKAYGYLNLEDDYSKTGIVDGNVEKGPLLKVNSPNAPTSVLTYDIYSVLGQGVGNSFRAYRNDIGTMYDASSKSSFAGGSVGVDLSVLPHFGWNVSANSTKNTSGYWENNASKKYSFQDLSKKDGLWETSYFKPFGENTVEPSMSYVGGDEVLELSTLSMLKMLNYNSSVSLLDKVQPKYLNSENQIRPIEANRKERRRRNNSIVSYTNEEIYNKGTGHVYLPTFDVGVDRSASHIQPNHIAGFTNTTVEGARYNYALPVYNKKHIEELRSTSSVTKKTTISSPNYNGKYRNKKEIPPYVHTYLLTSVLGTDYVDVDNNGPSEDDLGYWVKFNYEKVDDHYAWRSPYEGYNYMEGLLGSHEDNKTSYLTGEREVWLLTSVETKTHKATFNLEDREDNRSAKDTDDNGIVSSGDSPKRLKSIVLKSKLDSSVPIKTVHFEYNYELIKGLPNSLTKGGKLTLSKLYFTYQNSQRGAKTPYIFEYNKIINGEEVAYSTHATDRWGIYKNSGTEAIKLKNAQYPYTKQFENGQSASVKADLDKKASLWNLKTINLPTGASLNVEYERDDYGYVQDKVAMQMHPVTGTDINGSSSLDVDEYKLHFELEKYISTDAMNPQQELSKYFDETGLLYYKSIVHIKNDLPEHITGYLEIENFDVDVTSILNGEYTRGWVKVKPRKKKGKQDIPMAHPIRIDALQLLRMSHSDKIFQPGTTGMPISEPVSKSAKVSAVKSLLSLPKVLSSAFRNIYKWCIDQGYASTLDLDQTYIRLNSIDKIKFGGGIRVKKISMNDNWEYGQSEYGQIYDYTTLDKESGARISSGVASFEPTIGGDENALKVVKTWVDDLKMTADNFLTFEYPINESLYPSASVGYSMVTVKSLVADKVLSKKLNSAVNSTGAIVNEFYTYKDFPVFTEETEFNLEHTKNTYMLIPPLGTLIDKELTGTQGYKIELNDMHGKPKKISNHKMSKDGEISKTPYQYTMYNYKHNSTSITDPLKADKIKKINVLNNNIVYWDANTNVQKEGVLGVDYDMFNDSRYSRSRSFSGGANLNLDLIPVPFLKFPIPSWLPNIYYSTNKLQIMTTNKMVHRSGILESVISYNDGATITTTNEVYDKTGMPILTSVNNSFDEKVYNYNHLAYWEYPGMGEAYKTEKLRFQDNAELVKSQEKTIRIYGSKTENQHLLDQLMPGAELLVYYKKKDNLFSYKPTATKAYFMNKIGANYYFEVDDYNGLYHSVRINNPKLLDFTVIRSGKRNQLTVSSMSLASLRNPFDRRQNSCTASIKSPKVGDKAVKVSNCAYLLYDGLNKLVNAVNKGDYETLPYGVRSDQAKAKLGVVSSCEQNKYTLNLSMCGSTTYNENNYANLIDNRSDEFKFRILWDKREGINMVDGSKCSYPEKSSLSGANHRYALKFARQDDAKNWHDIKKKDLISLGTPIIDYEANIQTYPEEWGELTTSNKSTTSRIYSGLPYGICSIAKFRDSEDGQIKTDTLHYLTNYFVNGVIMFKHVLYDINSSVASYPVEYEEVDSVLSVSAQTYAEGWSRNYEELRRYGDGKDTIGWIVGDDLNAYARGERGVWMPHKTFVYSKDRQSSESVNLKEDGIMNKVALFNFSNPYFEDCDLGWVKANTVTNFDLNYNQIENKDALGNYSSALYGYKGTLSTAVAGNSTIREVGYNGFEEGLNAGNLLFGKSGETLYDIYEIESAKGNVIFSDIPYDTVPSEIDFIHLRATTNYGAEYVSSFAKYKLLDKQEDEVGNTVFVVGNGFANGGAAFPDFPTEIATNPWKGQIAIPRSVKVNNSGRITTDKSHTGDYSLKVGGSLAHAEIFHQNKIQLEKGKEYILEGWVSTDNAMNYDTYETMFSFRVEGVEAKPSGNIIDGWQRIQLKFKSENPSFSIDMINRTNIMYVDDLRIYPADGSMQSYVYDEHNYRLLATLDQNNYATFYKYDEEGNLEQVQKETEKGIRTIQESELYIKEQ